MNRFTEDFFIQNRNRLIAKLPDSVLVIPANCMLQYSADVAYPFRQDSNFWYLSGLEEPDLVLVINTNTNESVIFLPTRSDYKNLWDGGYDIKNFQKNSGIKKYKELENLESYLRGALEKNLEIGFLKPSEDLIEPYGFYANPARKNIAKLINKVCDSPLDVRIDIARLRQIKQKVEIDAIQEAINCTGKSLEKIKSNLESFQYESDLERQLTVEFYKNGSEGHGYEPIIASGVNAATIHYNKNNDHIRTDELVLLDVGAKVSGYSADISRTWAVGKITKRYKEVYQHIKQLQDIAFSLIKPGVLLRDYQEEMEKHTKKALKQLNASNAEEKFPHGFSHFLGLDVHDAGDYGSPLQEGSVLTVEPGIYLPDEGIGVRLEDNVLVTKNGIKNMSINISRDL